MWRLRGREFRRARDGGWWHALSEGGRDRERERGDFRSGCLCAQMLFNSWNIIKPANAAEVPPARCCMACLGLDLLMPRTRESDIFSARKTQTHPTPAPKANPTGLLLLLGCTSFPWGIRRRVLLLNAFSRSLGQGFPKCLTMELLTALWRTCCVREAEVM